MPRNGSGTYTLPAGNPVVTGTTISSIVDNNTMNDIATALTDSLSKTGQTTPTGNIPLGGFKIINLANGTATTDAMTVGQLASTASPTLGDYLVGVKHTGTGATARTQHDKNLEIISPYDFGGTGLGVADDSAAVLAASVAAVAAGKAVTFTGGTWLLGTQIALTTAHNSLRWILEDATIKKGFSGTLCTLTNTSSFAIDGVGVIDGQGGTYTGKGFVFSGSATTNPYFGAGILFTTFADAHLEFGADAGQYLKVDSNFRAGGIVDAKIISCTGPDTGAMQRDINGSMNGYISLTGTQAVHVKSPLLTRVEISSTCQITTVTGVSWSNGSAAMTLSGSVSIITGCRFAGNVTLDANFTGVFVGNIQTDGTFTDSTVAGNALVLHHDLSATYERWGRHKLRVVSNDDMILYSRTVSVGDASGTLTPGGSAPLQRWATTLTADRTLTLSDTAAEGDRFLITRSGAGDFLGKIVRANTFLLGVLLQNGWALCEHDGTSWNIVESGQITGGNKALRSFTAVGNVGGGTDDLISLTLWGGAIGPLIGDAFAVANGVRIKAWGTTVNNANAKTVTLVFGGSTILTTALTINQASTWELEATVLATGNNTQKYVSRMLQGGATTIVDIENNTLAITDANAIIVKCTGAATTDNDIVNEGMTIEFLN